MQDRASHWSFVASFAAVALCGACRQVDVVAVDVANIEVEPAVLSLKPGETQRLSVWLTSENGEELVGRAIEWSSSDPDVASVADDGRVTARGEGVARIVARVDGAEGAATVNVEPARPAVPPDAPDGLRAEAVDENRIDLTWKDRSDNESRFVVQRAHSVISGWTFEQSLSPNTTTYADTGLEEDHRYWYRVLACNDIGCSASAVVAKRTKD